MTKILNTIKWIGVQYNVYTAMKLQAGIFLSQQNIRLRIRIFVNSLQFHWTIVYEKTRKFKTSDKRDWIKDKSKRMLEGALGFFEMFISLIGLPIDEKFLIEYFFFKKKKVMRVRAGIRMQIYVCDTFYLLNALIWVYFQRVLYKLSSVGVRWMSSYWFLKLIPCRRYT